MTELANHEKSPREAMREGAEAALLAILRKRRPDLIWDVVPVIPRDQVGEEAN